MHACNMANWSLLATQDYQVCSRFYHGYSTALYNIQVKIHN
jgi:hypothetical protein